MRTEEKDVPQPGGHAVHEAVAAIFNRAHEGDCRGNGYEWRRLRYENASKDATRGDENRRMQAAKVGRPEDADEHVGGTGQAVGTEHGPLPLDSIRIFMHVHKDEKDDETHGPHDVVNPIVVVGGRHGPETFFSVQFGKQSEQERDEI